MATSPLKLAEAHKKKAKVVIATITSIRNSAGRVVSLEPGNYLLEQVVLEGRDYAALHEMVRKTTPGAAGTSRDLIMLISDLKQEL